MLSPLHSSFDQITTTYGLSGKQVASLPSLPRARLCESRVFSWIFITGTQGLTSRVQTHDNGMGTDLSYIAHALALEINEDPDDGVDLVRVERF
jgi:hypothetical protein